MLQRLSTTTQTSSREEPQKQPYRVPLHACFNEETSRDKIKLIIMFGWNLVCLIALIYRVKTFNCSAIHLQLALCYVWFILCTWAHYGHYQIDKYTLLFKVPLSPSSLVPSTSPDPHPLSSFHNYILYLFPLGFLALLAFSAWTPSVSYLWCSLVTVVSLPSSKIQSPNVRPLLFCIYTTHPFAR